MYIFTWGDRVLIPYYITENSSKQLLIVFVAADNITEQFYRSCFYTGSLVYGHQLKYKYVFLDLESRFLCRIILTRLPNHLSVTRKHRFSRTHLIQNCHVSNMYRDICSKFNISTLVQYFNTSVIPSLKIQKFHFLSHTQIQQLLSYFIYIV